MDKYFPTTVREEKAREFELLMQTKEMSVDQYEAKFSILSRYALELVNTPEKRAMWFDRGLLARIQTPLIALMLIDYRELHRRTRKLERTQREWEERGIRRREDVAGAENSQKFARSAGGGRTLRREGPSGAP